MTGANTIDSPPDWTQPRAEEIVCPLCEYNLRGLIEPRCPECGFTFAWSELLDGLRFKHPYLFEHQTKRNIWSFLTTYSNTIHPGKFWVELSPSHPIRLLRLLLYWFLSAGAMLMFLAVLLAIPLENYQQNSGFTFFTPSSTSGFPRGVDIFGFALPENLIMSVALILIWPLLTLVSLSIFLVSMKKAKINYEHMVRVVIYGCDFGLLVAMVLVYLYLLGSFNDYTSKVTVAMALACAVIGTYRMSFAYSRYLRFHLPLLTVLASQVIVFLVVFVVLARTTKLY